MRVCLSECVGIKETTIKHTRTQLFEYAQMLGLAISICVNIEYEGVYLFHPNISDAR